MDCFFLSTVNFILQFNLRHQLDAPLLVDVDFQRKYD